MEQHTLTEFIRWTGVILALVASLLAAPHAVQHYAQRAIVWLIIAFRRLTRRTRSTAVRGSVAAATGVAGGVGVIRMEGSSTLTLDGRVGLLETKVDRLDGALADLSRTVGANAAEHRQEFSRVWTDLGGEVGKLRQRLDLSERTTLEVDGRALPLVGLGILLSGVPEYIASWPLVTVVLLTGAVAWTTWAVVAFIDQWLSARKEAHHDDGAM